MFKRKTWIILGIILMIFVIILLLKFSGNTPRFEYTTEPVKRGALIQTVEATGTTEPAQTVELHFAASGTLATKAVAVGQIVKANDLLLSLDNREATLRAEEARGALAQAQGNLNKILAGASAAELNVSIKSVDKARADVASAEQNLTSLKIQLEQNLNTYRETVNKAEADLTAAQQTLNDTKALQNQNITNIINGAKISIDKTLADGDIALDEVQKIIDTEDIEIYLGVGSLTNLQNEEASRATAKSALWLAQNTFSANKAILSEVNISTTLTTAINAADALFTELKNMFTVLMDSTTSADFTDSELNAFKANITNMQLTLANDLNTLKTTEQNLANARLNRDSQVNTAQASWRSTENALAIARANLNLAQASQNTQLNSAENSLASARAALQIAEAELNYKSAAPRAVDTAAYQGAVKQLQAAYETALKNLADTELRSPIAATVTALNYEIGEQISAAGSPAAKIVNLDGFEIKVDISESDIAKVALDNDVDIDFDAFGEDYIVHGKVIDIEPAETIIQDVIYYKVTISLENDELVRPGLTANVTIRTGARDNVLHIPRRAVIEKDGQKVVKILDGVEPREVPVKTGLKADDGLIEIIDGLSEGQPVVTYTKELN